MRIRNLWEVLAKLAVLLLTSAVSASAQQGRVLQPGETAPDFQLTGATRYGVLADPVHLSDFRGNWVVLAFYFEARTPG